MKVNAMFFVECLLNLAACLRDRLEDLIDPDSLSVSGVPTGVRKGEPGCKKTLDWAREGALRRPPGLLGAPEIFSQKQILGTICRLPEHHVCVKGVGCEKGRGGWGRLSNVIAASCQYDRAHCRGEKGGTTRWVLISRGSRSWWAF